MRSDPGGETELYSRIQDHAVRRVSWVDSGRSNLHILRDVLRRGSEIRAYQQRLPIRRNTVMVFSDDAPLLNWAHPCRYVLYDAATAEPSDEVAAQFPPYLTQVPETFQLFHEPVPVRTDGRSPYLKPASLRHRLLAACRPSSPSGTALRRSPRTLPERPRCPLLAANYSRRRTRLLPHKCCARGDTAELRWRICI